MRAPLALLALAIATPLIAQQASQLPGSKNPAAVSGGTYTVDSAHTLVSWRVDHFGFNDYFGIFGDATGTLVIDPKNPAAAKVDITIPVSKVTTANPGLTAHLLKPAAEGSKPDFFGANPTDARFVSTSVAVDEDGDEAKVTGNLTLNGVTRPVVLDAEFVGAGKMPAQMGGKENVGFHAETTIKRSDFGIAFAIPMVSDAVELDISVAFQK
jgi:polyisoprenoid-binding protein YceI